MKNFEHGCWVELVKSPKIAFIFHSLFLFLSPLLSEDLQMNQNILWILILLNLFIVSALGVDSHYEACKVPRTCFNDTQEIRYPFYIQGQQKAFCGFPGFNLSCNNNGQPVIRLSDNDYIIHQIFYNNQSLRVSNAAAFYYTNTNCVPPIQNLSLPATNPFQPISATNIFLLYNCSSSSIDRNLTEYKLDCPGTGNGSSSTLALFEENPDLGYALDQCRNGIVTKAPVDANGMRSDGLVVETLRTGFGLSWTASNCSVCERSGGKCGFDYQVYQFRCFCTDRHHSLLCVTVVDRSRWKRKVAIGVGAAFGSIAIMCTIVFCIIRKMLSNADDPELEAIIKDCGPLPLKRYSFSDVKKITSSFKEKLGQGGYGCVYKGKQLDGRLVAVKVLNTTKGNGAEFVNEVVSISRTSHVNIVTLLGFCLEGSKRALIYEFMSNGSLEKFICNKSKASTNQQQYLGWENLYQIAIKIAQGLEYLHQGCNTRILHFDIKPHNILLDEDFCPKISDFGLAKLCTKKESIVSLLE
ncbi:hypothetical protein HS088_TW16G00077 [Tripterygium wilfordii]|uniref:non-specific serine/threonine protein kinase n=1 Tax=Tripterygium wilfordii TaxID=458696 RepID=A0A7J7CHW0_TRIWF|nr:hypothetical protein HS088_TW16G00077 [Tripterygium wilfordii]